MISDQNVGLSVQPRSPRKHRGSLRLPDCVVRGDCFLAICPYKENLAPVGDLLWHTRLYTSSNDRGNFNSVDRHHSMRFRSGTRRECQEGSEILPKWSQFDTHRVTQGM